jgi:predicted secreted protein
VQIEGPCTIVKQAYAKRPVPGFTDPQCTPFGLFQVIQHHGSTGYRYCVHPLTGDKIEGTEVAPGDNRHPKCGRCLYALAKFHSAQAQFGVSVGATQPQCDARGLYNALQGSGSTGYTWCVNTETGEKIEGTDTGPTAVAICDGVARETRGIRGPCKKLGPMTLRPPGMFTPQCTPFGFFQVIQRHSSTGYRWCANPETGAKIEGTEVEPASNAVPQCGQCLYELAKYHGHGRQNIGVQYPACDTQGRFNATQISASSGYSWCVDPETGDKIEGSEVHPATGQAHCEAASQTRGIAQGPCKTLPPFTLRPPGSFSPKCNPFGYFQVIQSHPSTGYSWCVNPETGEKIEGSDVKPGENRLIQCGKCLSSLLQFHSHGHVSVGLAKPSCDAQGRFNPTQSSGSSGYTWCVEPETGDKIVGTEVAPGAGQAQCDGRQKRNSEPFVGPCTKLHSTGSRRVGKYVPQCTDLGLFQVEQKHPSTGYRWCVHPVTGEKAEGSELSPADNRVLQCGKCLTDLAQYHETVAMWGIGGTAPQCDASGHYNQIQSSGSSGYSWCVNTETGEKIEGTETGPTHGPNCDGVAREKRQTGQCAQELEATAGGPPMPGSFTPQCTSKGHYNVIQSHGSTGFSWCVNPTSGVKIESTEVRGEPTCPACLNLLAQSLEKILIGAYRPQCETNGHFKKVQISASTGMAWCADPVNGQKLTTPQRWDGTLRCDMTNN